MTAEAATYTSYKEILERVRPPAPISLDCSALARGIDNYHIDVDISPEFTFKLRESIDQNLKRLVTGKQMVSGNSDSMVELRNAYTDLMKVTFHRTKTDLAPEQISVLQFAVVKFVIQEVRDAFDGYNAQLEETMGQQQYAGSRSLLATQEKLTWYRKHIGEFVYRMTRHYLRQLQREENNQLRALREQMLGDFPEASNVMFNPLLYARSPREPILLLDYYVLWPGSGAEFGKVNEVLEKEFARHFKNLPFDALKVDQKLESSQSEVYDELGGLFAVQPLLGPSHDQKQQLTEEFSWLDHPGNIRLLFDTKIHGRLLEDAKELGRAKAWSLKGDLKKLEKIAQSVRKALGDNKSVKLLLASYVLKEKLTQADLDAVEIEDALAFVAQVNAKRLRSMVDPTQEAANVLQDKLEQCKREYDRMFREADSELFVRFLSDYCRYRLHLKYYRFAHRVFNRLSVITEPEKIQLAKAGGNLYRLQSSAEVKGVDIDDQPEIVHHAILKADVRGSTTVTNELIKQGLNPASYFSLRFFNPINERLKSYGAVKVFIEGDAVILGHYEYHNSPDEWFSVSRACGIAKEMLDIVSLKNANSSAEGLPVLEIGIGICYEEDKPLFLFDENRPIMISSAIGNADRMSSCSWRLRKNFDPGNFNVAVFKYADDDPHAGEKGQELVRYNVNGIVIDDRAFEKLQQEVHFQRLKAKSGNGEEIFYVGQYPDVHGKQRDLVVRQGRVGVWREDAAQPDADTGLVFYEVLPNSRFAAQIAKQAS